jgi:hypothetical protein
MSTKSGCCHGHRFHGDPERFPAVASFVFNHFGHTIKYIADVAGGRGMLTRILNKKYGYQTEVVDPRGWALTGVPTRKAKFTPAMADFYDLIIGLHPDEATRTVAEAAEICPTILIPCCNFWDRSRKLGRNALLAEIGRFYTENRIECETVTFDFSGPKNIGLVTTLPQLSSIPEK